MAFQQMTPLDAGALAALLTADDPDYARYFLPFDTDVESLGSRLDAAVQDRYWGIWLQDRLAGFFMMRGLDEGYQRPAFGVYVARDYCGRGLASLALRFCMSWCRINGIDAMMLKVHPENRYARQLYRSNGFSEIGTCLQSHHRIMERRWSAAG